MITDNFIKQCEQAEELQENWRERLFKNYVGDWYWKGKEFLQIKEACHIVTSMIFTPKKEIWLPTIEQLFEMALYLYDEDEPQLLGDLMEFIELNEYGIPFKENLLAFVMHEKYHKIWTGEKWEVVKED